MENKGDFLAGVVIGTAVGALLGLLFAPAPGEETRQKVAEKGKEVGAMAIEKAKEKSEVAIETAKAIIEQVKEKLPDSKEVHEALNSIENDIR